MTDPFKVVRDFEAAVCEYTGAPYCVTTNSCTMALLLACAYWKTRCHSAPMNQWGKPIVEIPKRTYVGVPMAIRLADCVPAFRDEDWIGSYQLKPFPVWDCARYFSSGMYETGHFDCVSFHSSKVLGDTQGGAILHNNYEADQWLRRARFDGRTEGIAPKDDTFDMLGWHAYMSPDVAARLLWKLSRLPRQNDPLPNDDYPDLSLAPIFQ